MYQGTPRIMLSDVVGIDYKRASLSVTNKHIVILLTVLFVLFSAIFVGKVLLLYALGSVEMFMN